MIKPLKKKLINRSSLREYILEQVYIRRTGWECTQVSNRALTDLEVKFQAMVDRTIHSHPTIGKTFTEVL